MVEKFSINFHLIAEKQNLHIRELLETTENIKIYPILPSCFSYRLDDILKLFKTLRKLDFDILHIQYGFLHQILTSVPHLLFRILNKPIIWTIHDVFPLTNKWQETLLWNINCHLSDALIVHQDILKEEIINQYKIDSDKIFVILHGDYIFFDRNQFSKETAKQELGIEAKFTVLHFGYMKSYKGPILLLKTIKNLIKRNFEDVLFLVVGKFVYSLNRFNKYIEKLGIKKYVKIVPEFVPDDQVELYFKASDMVVLPYISASRVSGIIQSAYAFNKPVVATNVGGIGKTIEEDRTGLVTERTPNALGTAILNVLTDLGLQEKFINNIQFAKTKYSWDTIAEKTFELYKKLL